MSDEDTGDTHTVECEVILKDGVEGAYEIATCVFDGVYYILVSSETTNSDVGVYKGTITVEDDDSVVEGVKKKA